MRYREVVLVRFRVSNYRSIRDAVELIFQADGGDDESSAPRRTDVAAIFGANASGKSNVLAGLFFMRNAVLASHTSWRPSVMPTRHPFALDPESSTHPTFFEVDILIDGIRYQYGFALDDKAFTHEWLYTFPEGRRRMMFERDRQTFTFGRALKGHNRTIAELVRPNSLFLSTAATNNHELLTPIYDWFEQILFAGWPPGGRTDSEITQQMLESGHRSAIEELLALADLGIRSVSIRREDMPDEIVTAVAEFVTSIAKRVGQDVEVHDLPRTHTSIEFEHKTTDGATAQIAHENESRGTQMWFAYIGPVLRALEKGLPLIIDELDASLHPRLSREIIRLFKEFKTNPNRAQLIFSTHDTALLGHLVGETLSREDVWFTEKDSRGATILYPLTEFRPRKDEALERGYLLGRYGAVPIVDFSDVAERLTVG